MADLYSPEELRTGANAVTDKAWTIDLSPSGPSSDINHEGVAKAVLDAVLPGHDKQLLEPFCDCESAFCDEGCRACEPFGDCLRAAALAAPVERLRLVDKTTHAPCPTRGNLLCTITDRDHLHVDARLLAAPVEPEHKHRWERRPGESAICLDCGTSAPYRAFAGENPCPDPECPCHGPVPAPPVEQP